MKQEPRTILVPLTNGKFTVVDECDAWVMEWKWYASKDPRRGAFYARRNVRTNGKKSTISLHRVITGAKPGQCVDHVDGNGLNNQRANLRLATTSQNAINRGPQRDNTSGFKGVYWYKHDGKWRAQIRVNGKGYVLGCFSDPAEAARAYDIAAMELHGEFAWLNFPVSGNRGSEVSSNHQ